MKTKRIDWGKKTKLSQLEKTLVMLKRNKFCTTLDFIKEGMHRFSASLHILRKKGYKIVTERHELGYIYYLIK